MASPLLYPAIGGAPGSSIRNDPAQAPDRIGGGAKQTEEFGKVFEEAANAAAVSEQGSAHASGVLRGSELRKAVTEPIKFSAHASARISSRKLDVGPEQMRKLGEAVDKAAAKGLDDTLILTKDAAFIVSVKNKTVVTAMDRAALEGNVFTNIEGAVII